MTRRFFKVHLLGCCTKREQPACQRGVGATDASGERFSRTFAAGRGAACDDARRTGNIRRGVGSTRLASGAFAALVAMSCVGLLTMPAAAQDAGAVAVPENQPTPAADVTPPTPDDAMKAYADVERAVRSWAIPGTSTRDGVRVGACCVTLRARGRVLGRGEAVGGDANIAGATRDAMIQAQSPLAALRDELAFTTLAEAAAMVSIGVEFSGALVPLDFTTFGEMDRSLAPGLDGVAVRVGQKIEATFPSVILQRSIAPGLASAAAAARLTGDPRLGLPEAPEAQPGKVRESHHATFYRFRVTHLVQTSPDAPPVFLHRGGKIFDVSRLDVPEMRRWADGMARNLVGRAWTGPGAIGMSGTDWPALGKTDPPIAGAPEQSLAIIAICDYLAVRAGVGRFELAPKAEHDAYGVMALLLADQLLTVEAEETPPWNEPLSAASTMLALHAVGHVVQPKYVPKAELVAKLDDVLWSAYSPKDGWSSSIPEPARGLVAWAMLVRAGDMSDADKAETANKAIAAIYLGINPSRLVAQMPWLGFAELDRSNGGDVAASTAYRDMRDLLSAAVFHPGDDDQDLAGGIVFTTSGLPLPTWHTVRPVAFLGAMLGDRRLTDADERPRQTARVMSNLRFLRQLSADEYVATSFADPKHTMWGVRSALWDQRQPVEATAMTLIAVCETLRSLDSMAARPPTP